MVHLEQELAQDMEVDADRDRQQRAVVGDFGLALERHRDREGPGSWQRSWV